MTGAISAAFAEFVVWLAVRIANRRERWAIWTGVGILAVAFYILLFGPAHCCYHRPGVPQWAKNFFVAAYRPLDAGYAIAPDPLRTAFDQYDTFWMRIGRASR